jgi:ABC-2 type transport system permease protein
MAVNKRSYKAYDGELTAPWRRMLVLPRYAWGTLLKQRFLTIFFVLCFFYPLGAALAIYVNNNLQFLAQYVPVPKNGLFEVGGQFFWVFLNVQTALAMILTAFVGPGLVSPDLVNGALPLYLSRPFSRFEYIGGKFLVIAGLLSQITWIPGLALWGLQASLAGGDWWRENLWLAWAIFFSSFLWISLLGLLSLALSAWVRWRIVAGALVLLVFFLGAGIGQAIDAVMRTEMGGIVDPARNLFRVTMSLFRRDDLSEGLTFEQSTAALAGLGAFCVLLLMRRVRACEVVK